MLTGVREWHPARSRAPRHSFLQQNLEHLSLLIPTPSSQVLCVVLSSLALSNYVELEPLITQQVSARGPRSEALSRLDVLPMAVDAASATVRALVTRVAPRARLYSSWSIAPWSFSTLSTT